ncbi:MAG: hypothetical protein RLZZ387_920 [Chloroflexota bacterium]|jgi:putative membrane protein (TIGR04086 family)
MAVLTGFVVDVLVTALISTLMTPTAESLAMAPDLSRADHLLLLGLGLASTAAGGYLAGRLAGDAEVLHGLLVGVVGVILAQLPAVGSDPPIPRVFVIASALGCAAGACGGLLSRYFPSPSRARG